VHEEFDVVTVKTPMTVASVTAAVTIALADFAHADTEYHFQSPSGNIACWLGDVIFNGGVECDIAQYTYALPARPADCPTQIVNFGDRFTLIPGQAAVMSCHGDTVRVPGEMQTLNYGQKLSLGQISCDSEQSGMICTDTSTGHYFLVSRDSYELR